MNATESGKKTWGCGSLSWALGVVVLFWIASLVVIYGGRLSGLERRFEPSNKEGSGLQVRLSYETGSAGIGTFFVRIKNVSGRELELVNRLRYYAGDHNNTERGEVAFQLCLVKPWGKVPLNNYTTRAINDSISGPIHPGQEITCEYHMLREDLERIGSWKVVAYATYSDPAGPAKLDTDGKTLISYPRPFFTAWSNVIQVTPLEWGLATDGVQVGLQVVDGKLIVKARNGSDRALRIYWPDGRAEAKGETFYLLDIRDFSGMGEALHNSLPVTGRHPGQSLRDFMPGQEISGEYTMGFDDIRKVGDRFVKARVIIEDPSQLLTKKSGAQVPRHYAVWSNAVHP